MKLFSVAFLVLFPLATMVTAEVLEPFEYCECESEGQLPLTTIVGDKKARDAALRPGDCDEDDLLRPQYASGVEHVEPRGWDCKREEDIEQ